MEAGEALNTIIAKIGLSAVNPKVLKSALTDLEVEKKLINLIIDISGIDYFSSFVKNVYTDQSTLEYEKTMLFHSVQEEYDFAEEYALMGVDCWAQAICSSVPLENEQKEAVLEKLSLLSRADSQNEADEKSLSQLAKKYFKNSQIQHIIKRAKDGDPQARYVLASMYEKGNELSPSIREAIKWYKLSAAKGYLKAILKLAEIYEQGIYVPKNLDESEKWYRLSIQYGNEKNDVTEKLKILKKLKKKLRM